MMQRRRAPADDPGAQPPQDPRRRGRVHEDGPHRGGAASSRVRHPRYNKTVQRTTQLYVDDEANDLNAGDRVRIQETRPLSKLKRWRILAVLERAR